VLDRDLLLRQKAKSISLSSSSSSLFRPYRFYLTATYHHVDKRRSAKDNWIVSIHCSILSCTSATFFCPGPRSRSKQEKGGEKRIVRLTDNRTNTLIANMVNLSELLANSWSSAAVGYNDLFVPRFSPWTMDAFEALSSALLIVLPAQVEARDGSFYCVVPCCGPGQELVPLANKLGPNWSVLGVDLAPGMIEVANQRIRNEATEEQRQRVQAVVGECSSKLPLPLPTLSSSSCYHVIFSVFGLQQMPDPVATIKVWIEALQPNNGLLVVCFWPPDVEVIEDQVVGEEDEAKPFTRWGEIVDKRLKDRPRRLAKESNWGDQVIQAAKEAGATLVKDTYLSHQIEWENIEQFWNGMTRSGPWHATRLTRGEDFVDSIKEEFCQGFSASKPIVHTARARMLVLQRGPSSEQNMSNL
jgi:SAM-dependent methyltransferase